jgi:hypothetical protein
VALVDAIWSIVYARTLIINAATAECVQSHHGIRQLYERPRCNARMISISHCKDDQTDM